MLIVLGVVDRFWMAERPCITNELNGMKSEPFYPIAWHGSQ